LGTPADPSGWCWTESVNKSGSGGGGNFCSPYRDCKSYPHPPGQAGLPDHVRQDREPCWSFPRLAGGVSPGVLPRSTPPPESSPTHPQAQTKPRYLGENRESGGGGKIRRPPNKSMPDDVGPSCATPLRGRKATTAITCWDKPIIEHRAIDTVSCPHRTQGAWLQPETILPPEP
jgi:hypothetical protein